MGITKDLVFEAMDRIIDSRKGYAFPHPEEAYKQRNFINTKRYIKRMLSKLGYVIIKESDFSNLQENCPTQYDEAGRKFLRFVLEKGEEIDKLFPLLSDEYSRSILNWFIQYRVCSALLGTRTNELYPPKFSDLEYEKGISSIFQRDKDNYIDTFDINNLKITTNKWVLYNSFILKQYVYKEIVSPKTSDYVLDIGACYGETSLWFSGMVGESGYVWAFEPDDVNYTILGENIRRNNIKNIQTVKKGAYNKNTQLSFDSRGAESKIVEQKVRNIVDVIKIDDFVEKQKIRRVNYVKMDIEGAERFAVEGMKDTIRRFKPSLALSVYHLSEDIVNIPKLVLGIFPHYRVYLDHFSSNFSETVMFFSPKSDKP